MKKRISVILPIILGIILIFSSVEAIAEGRSKGEKNVPPCGIVFCEGPETFSKELSKMQTKSEVNTAQNDASGNRRTGRIIVSGKPDFFGFSPVSVMQDSYGIYYVQFSEIAEADRFLEQQQSNPRVIFAEEDILIQSTDPAPYPETAANSLGSWGTDYIEASDMASYVRSQGKNQSVVVAVVDSGCDLDHSFLSSRLLSGYDYVDGDNYPDDYRGHGTHVAGTIVDCTPNLNVYILPVRVLDENGDGLVSNIAYGIRYAADCGASVINLSLGGKHNSSKEAAIEYALSKNCVVCVAAGNENQSTAQVCPAHMMDYGVIVVSSIDPDEIYSSFSNYGPSVDVAAPGREIYSSYLGGGYTIMEGTSQATPHVSAAAAMFRQLYPSASPDRIELLICQCTKDLGISGKDIDYGYGAIKLSKAKTAILPPTITKDPSNQSVFSGKTASFTVKASGSSIKYIWQVSSDNSTWTDVPSSYTGYNKATLEVPADSSTEGNYYRCFVYAGSVKVGYLSAPARLTLAKITTQPKSAKKYIGTKSVFSIETSGSGLSYHWQYRSSSKNGWSYVSSLSGNTTKKLTVPVTAARHKYQYRCEVTDSCGNKKYSSVATLTVKTKITAQPEDLCILSGNTAEFKVTATGTGLKYKWEYSTDGSNWNDLSVDTSSTNILKVSAPSSHNKYNYRCRITNKSGDVVYSDPAKLTVAVITAQPSDVSGYVGDSVQPSLSVRGTGLTFRWQVSTDGGTTWKNVSTSYFGYNKKALQLTVEADWNGYMYRCKIKDSEGNTRTSSPAKLTVLAKITTQPKSQTILLGKSASFKVVVSAASPKYQWQYRTESSGSWKNVTATSGTKSTYTFTTAARHDGYQYRCKITDANGKTKYSKTVTLTIGKLVKSPANASGYIGDDTSFSVQTSGNGLTYRWQYSKDGGDSWNYSSLTGNKTKTLTVSVTAGRNAYLYRCEIKDSAGNKVYSTSGKLIVLPKITSQPSAVSAYVGASVQLKVSASGAGLKYRWQVSKDAGETWSNLSSSYTGYNTETLSLTAKAAWNGYCYRCVITDANSKKLTSKSVKLTIKPKITSQPSDVSAYVGDSSQFSIKASGTGLTYRWQVSKDAGETWSNLSSSYTGYNTETLSLTAKAAWNGYCYRCVITDANSKKLTSKSVKLTIKPKITSQPSDVSAYVGDSAQFSIKASGTGLTYRWQVSKDAGETWSNLSSSYTGYNKTTLSLTVKAAWNGYQYRCAVTDTNGKQAFSSVAKLMIKPKITSQPSDVSAYVGDSVQFRINASGAGLTYRWQVSKDAGETWSNVASSYTGYNKATLQLMVNAAWNGYRYRCVVKDANGKVLNSSAATLSICLQIIEHPVSTTVLEGLVATFTVSADPDNVSYQWQFQSSDSLGWVDCEEESGITGTREKTLQVVSSVSMDGQFFRCIIMDEKGNSVISNSAVLHVIGILEQPTDENVLLGNTATFSVAACGGALSYQWQVRNSNSGDWIDCTSGNGFQTAIYSFTPDLDNNGKQYRCLVNDIESELSIASQTATLHMYGISQQPESVHTAAGESVFFEVQAIGNQLSYQWRQRVSQSSDWTDCPSSLNGYNADTLHLIATTDMDGFQYCCQINSDPYTMYSCVVDLHVLAIESDPASVFTTDGTTVSFHIAASGTGLQYQWQERGSEYDEWADVTYGTGCQTEEFSLTATPELDAMEYRCQVSDIYGTVLFSGSATLRVTGIISNPNNVEAYVNDTAVFAISATGAGLSYRWQTRSNSDDSWANVSPTWGGYQSDTLSVPVTDDINESEYRCIVIDELGNQVVSKTATLLILSRILQQPADVAAASGETVSFTIFASGAGLTYQWQCSEDGGKTWTDATENGSSTTTLELTMHISFSGYLYRCIIADSNGGSLTSNSAILTLPLIAFGTCGPNAFWKLDNAGMLVIGGSGTIDNYTQNGSLIDGGTAPWQYYYGRIKRIVVQEGISSIGDYAFAANQNNSIGGIDLPSTLTEIGDYAFCYTKNLSEIILPSDLSSIGKYAFCNSGLTKISIPEGITEVPERAFDECQRLLRVIIPANVTTIGMYAFRGCNALRAVQILNPLCIFYDYNSTLGPTSSVSVFGYDHSTAKTYAQKYGYTFQAITDDDVYIGEEPPVPAAVQSPIIASGTCGFYAVWDLDESGTLSIRGKGLMDNGTPPWESYYSSIKKVVIEEGITSIGDYAFALGDSQLAQVILPSTLKQIRNYAFEYARSLRSISLPHSLTSLGQYAFFSSGLVSISIPEGITEIPDYAFEYCYNLETFNLPSGLTRIGQYAFAYSKLQSITLPGSLATIEFSAFNNCKSLLGVTLPVSVSSVGRYAFNDCTAMTFVQVLNPECVLYDYNSTLGPTSSVTIYGYSDSTAETYAHKYGYAFSLIED